MIDRGESILPQERLAQFSGIDAELSELPIAMHTRIDRESRAHLEGLHPGLPMILRGTLQASRAAFSSVKRICYDRSNGLRPLPELATAVPPIARTFIDSLITIVFVWDQPSINADRYLKGGLCAELARFERLKDEYGSDAAWSQHLTSLKNWIDSHETGNPNHRVLLSDDQKLAPRAHARKLWPNPGQLIVQCSAERATHLQFVRDWFYDELSQDAHLSYMGLVRRSAPLHEQTPSAHAEEFRYRAFYGTIVVYLALLAEVATAAELRVEQRRIAATWKHLDGIPSADQLWQRRYRALLA